MDKINLRIADELNVQPGQVTAAVDLLNEGSTVPFIARYRKEKTGGLDDTQLRQLAERLEYLRQLEERRTTILKTIDEQGKLTPALQRSITAAANKVELEDLYAPYKKKRRTKAQIAKEAGLEPLTNALLADPALDPTAQAKSYISADKGIADATAALDGARSILTERIGEQAKLVGDLREWLWRSGIITAKLRKGKEAEGAKFADYFDFSQRIAELPSHRALALLRGRNLGILDLHLDVPTELGKPHPAELKIMFAMGIAARGRPADSWLADGVKIAWKARTHISLTAGLLARLKEQADVAAIDVFKSNLKDLLLAAPAGPRVTIGLDPGIRTGVKVAVVDQTGKLLDTATIYPHEPRRDWTGSLKTLAALCAKHNIEVIAIGNGTASRETDKLAADLIKLTSQITSQQAHQSTDQPADQASSASSGQQLTKVMVSEAGASIYSASELAAKEFPDLDVSLRGAVSIARRLQDPLAELVKIEPKAIGVGQYQHDVNQGDLARSLDAVVEDCVNAVGVDINTASAPLLTSVAGLNATIAQNILTYRDEHGAFKKRSDIKKVARLGPKAFEQAAGFLRIMDGTNPLDGSAVHPEAYDLVKRIAATAKRPVKSIIGDHAFLKSLTPANFADERFGIPTVSDILVELEKPGRDPRPQFKTASFADGVEKMSDLRPGMTLEGVVTNVTAFGAFIDVGVHQDGLVHVSQLADRFVKDPRDIVKAGDVVKVRVQDVDLDRKRIGLTMRSGEINTGASGGPSTPQNNGKPQNRSKPTTPSHRSKKQQSSAPESAPESALAAALRRAQSKG